MIAEYYPRVADPVLGIWAHRQAVAARDAGADVRVIVLHRPLPSLAAVRAGDVGAALAAWRQPRVASLDGVPVTYVRYLSPPRPWSYASWGAWAARALSRALAHVREHFRYDLIHAHNAVPAADAVRRVAAATPLVLSVHGGDLYGVAQMRGGARAVSAAMGHARLVLANSAGTARRCAELGARATRVVHLGTDLPAAAGPAPEPPVIVSVGNLIARKRHADVIAALPVLRARHPGLRYVIVGDGPERDPLRELAGHLGVGDAVQMLGALDPRPGRGRGPERFRVRHAERRGGVRRGLRGSDGRGRTGDRVSRRGRPAGDRRRGWRYVSGRRGRRAGAHRAHRRAALGPGRTRDSGPRRP